MAEHALITLSGRSVTDLIAIGKQALADAGSFEEVKAIRDQAEALRAYQRSIGAAQDAVDAAVEIKLRAERRMGEELAKSERAIGGRPEKTCTAEEQVSSLPTLPELGITRKQSSTWQGLARASGEQFEAAVEVVKEAGPLSATKVVQVVRTATEKAWTPADIRRSVREEALGGIDLPTPKEAERRAAAAAATRTDGAVPYVVGSDGKARGPAVSADKERLARHWTILDDAMRPMEECAAQLTPAQAVACVPLHLRSEVEPWLAKVTAFLDAFTQAWRHRDAA